jgi:hypothetical protein
VLRRDDALSGVRGGATPAPPEEDPVPCSSRPLLRGLAPLLLVTALFAATPTAAQPRPVLERRIAAIADLFRQKPPAKYGDLFGPEFLKAVPPEKIVAIITDARTRLGALTGTRFVHSKKPGSARYELSFAKGFAAPIDITVAKEPPHLIVGLWLGPEVRLAATLDEVAKDLQKLPGRVSFLAARIGPKGLEPRAALAPDRVLALGSAFKLWILGALVEEVAAGTRRWADVTPLEARWKSLPSGIMQDWPAGTAVTLQTLATLMISRSDNTATDHLLFLLGRERVEQQVARMGTKELARNHPFLSTAEMFRLKAEPTGKLRPEYLRKDLAGRRALLRGPVAAVPLEKVEHYTKPTAIDTLEWFASAADLGRALAWLRDHTATPATAPGRALLAVNPGLGLSKEKWRYIGYKGGSEPGVLCMAWLLQSQQQEWYALAVVWNDDQGPAEVDRLAPFVLRAAELLK